MFLFWVKLRRNSAAIEMPFRGDGLALLDSNRVRICAGVRINSRAHLVILARGHLSIGEGSLVGSDAVIACSKQVTIGERVLIAARCFISDTSHVYTDISCPIVDQGVTDGQAIELEDGCWIGINVCIFPGVRVGRNAVVGANSVVTRDIPPRSVACGAPARVIRQYDPVTGEWVNPQSLLKAVR